KVEPHVRPERAHGPAVAVVHPDDQPNLAMLPHVAVDGGREPGEVGPGQFAREGDVEHLPAREFVDGYGHGRTPFGLAGPGRSAAGPAINSWRTIGTRTGASSPIRTRPP